MVGAETEVDDVKYLCSDACLGARGGLMYAMGYKDRRRERTGRLE